MNYKAGDAKRKTAVTSRSEGDRGREKTSSASPKRTKGTSKLKRLLFSSQRLETCERDRIKSMIQNCPSWDCERDFGSSDILYGR